MNIDKNIYRFTFNNAFTEELFRFSKIHQYDDRKVFKEAWDIWAEDNEEIISEETKRLQELGYEGNIQDKMFKSARYYFINKSTERKEPSKRRNYVGLQKELLESMDEYLKENKNVKPSESFDEFCKNNIELIKDSIDIIYRSGITDSQVIKSKIKKTFKNRYFIINSTS
jgi:hypothetical protein